MRTLDKSQRLAAKKFLESPYFNKSKEIIILFLEILKLQEKEKPLDKVKLWKKIVQNKPYNDLRFRKFCSDLSKLIERFLAQQAFEEDPLQMKLFLLTKLSQQEQRAQKSSKTTTNLSKKMIQNHPYRDHSYFLYRYQLQRSFYDLENFGTKRGVRSNIEEISSSLDSFYIGEKLRLITDAESRKSLKAREYEIAFTDTILQLAQSSVAEKDHLPHIDIYLQIYQLLSNSNADESYFRLKELIKENAHLFPQEVAIEELYGAAQNYCVKKINSGDRSFLNELFELFKLQIEQSLLLSDGRLSPWYFRNIIVVALRLGEYDWVEDFINRFKDDLPESHKENAVTYNMAQLYFYQKKYNKVLEQLRFVEYDDMSYNLNSKVMLMLTYYELDEFDLLDSHLDTFEVFLKRRKDFTADRKQIYIWLIKYTRRLTRIIPSDKKALQKLKEDIQSTKGVVNANWLLEKIAELE